MEKPEPHPSSQQIKKVKNSAVSYSGNATNYNIEGDYYAPPPKPWKPPLMLPPRAQSFVGRKEDLKWLRQHLTRKSEAILTLCGPGGIGKTALAAEALSRLVKQKTWSQYFPDGIFYYSFYGNSSLNVALEELVRVFGEEPGGDPLTTAKVQ